jgi:hypothetical protein
MRNDSLNLEEYDNKLLERVFNNWLKVVQNYDKEAQGVMADQIAATIANRQQVNSWLEKFYEYPMVINAIKNEFD